MATFVKHDLCPFSASFAGMAGQVAGTAVCLHLGNYIFLSFTIYDSHDFFTRKLWCNLQDILNEKGLGELKC